jgi:hypothetical protein
MVNYLNMQASHITFPHWKIIKKTLEKYIITHSHLMGNSLNKQVYHITFLHWKIIQENVFLQIYSSTTEK